MRPFKYYQPNPWIPVFQSSSLKFGIARKSCSFSKHVSPLLPQGIRVKLISWLRGYVLHVVRSRSQGYLQLTRKHKLCPVVPHPWPRRYSKTLFLGILILSTECSSLHVALTKIGNTRRELFTIAANLVPCLCMPCPPFLPCYNVRKCKLQRQLQF
jgi:hypothetical protein